MNKNNASLEQWFSEVAAVLGIHKDINHPSNRDYDYIAAYYSGVSVPKLGQELPSEFKGELNSTRFINLDGEGDYYDTKTDQIVGVQDKMIQDVRRQERRENFLDQE
tara:strand:+ start:332 stop:652 length:321 start_codon:yes stop_codon:yes gene_type:complete